MTTTIDNPTPASALKTFTRKPCNEACRQFLISLGCPAKVRVRYIGSGSLKGCWSVYSPDGCWNQIIKEGSVSWWGILNAAKFTGFDRKPLNQYSGNGGAFSTFLRGHNEFLEAV